MPLCTYNAGAISGTFGQKSCNCIFILLPGCYSTTSKSLIPILNLPTASASESPRSSADLARQVTVCIEVHILPIPAEHAVGHLLRLFVRALLELHLGQTVKQLRQVPGHLRVEAQPLSGPLSRVKG